VHFISNFWEHNSFDISLQLSFNVWLFQTLSKMTNCLGPLRIWNFSLKVSHLESILKTELVKLVLISLTKLVLWKWDGLCLWRAVISRNWWLKTSTNVWVKDHWNVLTNQLSKTMIFSWCPWFCCSYLKTESKFWKHNFV